MLGRVAVDHWILVDGLGSLFLGCCWCRRSIFILLWTASFFLPGIILDSFGIHVVIVVIVALAALWRRNFFAILTAHFLRSTALLFIWICHHKLGSFQRGKCNRLLLQLGLRADLTILRIVKDVIVLVVFGHQAI